MAWSAVPAGQTDKSTTWSVQLTDLGCSSIDQSVVAQRASILFDSAHKIPQFLLRHVALAADSVTGENAETMVSKRVLEARELFFSFG
jgi:hypothetical protein